MITGDLWRASATELAEAIRTGQVSSAEVVKAHLERITAVNPAVNAVTAVLEQDALAAADAADQALGTGQPVGPLHGVPVTVKEGIDLAGSATTQGVPAFANAIAPLDAPHIAQLVGPRYREDLCLDVAQEIEGFFGTVTPIDPI